MTIGKNMSQRQIVREKLKEIPLWYILDGTTPGEVITYMQKLTAENQESDTYFKLEYGYGDDGDELYLYLYQRREENDAEYTLRTAKEKKERDAKKAEKSAKVAKELAEYERLKKKFG